MIFQTPEQLQTAVDEYFGNTRKPTLSGLAYSLNIDRQTLYNYADREKYFDIIKRAQEKVESVYEERLIYENNPTGVIFALKNMGWKDKQEIEQRTVSVSFEDAQ